MLRKINLSLLGAYTSLVCYVALRGVKALFSVNASAALFFALSRSTRRDACAPGKNDFA